MITPSASSWPRTCPLRFIVLGLVLLAPRVVLAAVEPTATRPNVLLIILDDFAPDWSQLAAAGPAYTPNLQRLAKRGVVFRQAYTPAPSCCPSRTSLLTGVEPHRSGVYLNNQAYRRSQTWIGQVTNLPQHFRAHGYLAAAFGKVSHHDFQDDDAAAWTEGYFFPLSNQEDVDYGAKAKPNLVVPAAPSFYQWGPLPDEWDRGEQEPMQQDTRNTNLAIDLVRREQAKPFLCALGLFRPHLRWYAPQRFFDRYPLDRIQVPPPGYRADDIVDLPAAGMKMRRQPIYDAIVKNGLWRQAVQAYLASITYADEQVGRVLDALEAGPHARNTIVVLISDNGWHNGEKEHFSKFTLWEQSTKVACLISAPGVRPGVCDSPVSLVDLFPTLNALCRLPPPAAHELDGVNLGPLLANTSAMRGRPVLSTHTSGNHAVRSERFRYIKYSDGGEELYDHRADPYEWRNLASDPTHAAAKAELAKHIPAKSAQPIRTSGAATGG